MVRIMLEYGADAKEISGPGPMWEQVLKRARVSSATDHEALCAIQRRSEGRSRLG